MDNTMITHDNTKYSCSLCLFSSNRKTEYTRHISSKKHKLLHNIEIFEIDNNETWNCKCGRKYNHQPNLSRHKKDCKYSEEKQLLIELKEQQEKMQEVIKQLKDEQEQMKMNANVVSKNQKFNIDFYLKDTCKNALNIRQFVDSLDIRINDILEMADIGYEIVLIKIFLNGLNKLKQEERPIQTVDRKRKIHYVKSNNNEWVKEVNSFNCVNSMIDYTGDKSFYMLHCTTKTTHKFLIDTTNYKMNEIYNKSIIQILAITTSNNKNKDFNKIHNRLLENTEIERMTVI